MAEVSRRWSPYNYCYNNPLRFTDPDGMMSTGRGGETLEEWMATKEAQDRERNNSGNADRWERQGMERHAKNTNAYQAQRKANYFGALLKSVKGAATAAHKINGGHTISNTTKQETISIHGSSGTAKNYHIGGGTIGATDDGNNHSVELRPGEKFEPIILSAFGMFSTTFRYTGKIVSIETGEVVRDQNDVGIFDVDGIVMRPGQNFIDNEGQIRNSSNTNTIDGMPWEIKIQPGLINAVGRPYIMGAVTISDASSGNIQLQPQGTIELLVDYRLTIPSIRFGKKK